jgi:hypothetical protein
LVGKENFAEVVSSLEEKVKEMRIGKEVCVLFGANVEKRVKHTSKSQLKYNT